MGEVHCALYRHVVLNEKVEPGKMMLLYIVNKENVDYYHTYADNNISRGQEFSSS